MEDEYDFLISRGGTECGILKSNLFLSASPFSKIYDSDYLAC